MKKLVVLLAGMAIIWGCAGSGGKVDKGAAPEAKIRGLENLDESFDPSELQEPPLPIKSKAVKESSQGEKQQQVSEQDTTQVQEIMGYRVQILQTEDAQEAREVQKDAILDLDADVYLIYDNPYYKVRVGDFESRYEAETFLEKILRKGYQSAWIVRTKITPASAKKEQK